MRKDTFFNSRNNSSPIAAKFRHNVAFEYTNVFIVKYYITPAKFLKSNWDLSNYYDLVVNINSLIYLLKSFQTTCKRCCLISFGMSTNSNGQTAKRRSHFLYGDSRFFFLQRSFIVIVPLYGTTQPKILLKYCMVPIDPSRR